MSRRKLRQAADKDTVRCRFAEYEQQKRRFELTPKQNDACAQGTVTLERMRLV